MFHAGICVDLKVSSRRNEARKTSGPPPKSRHRHHGSACLSATFPDPLEMCLGRCGGVGGPMLGSMTHFEGAALPEIKGLSECLLSFRLSLHPKNGHAPPNQQRPSRRSAPFPVAFSLSKSSSSDGW